MRLTLLFIAAAFRCSLSDVLIGDVVIEEHSEAKNWRNASRVCKENSGHLVRDCPEFHDQLPTGTFWLDKVNIAATGWSDGSVVEGEFWAQNERCIVVKDGVWHIKDCTSEHKFLCQRPWSWEDEGFDTTTAKGRAIKYFSEKLTWDAAEEKCNTGLILPGHLLTVDSEKVSDWVEAKKVELWIGLNDKDTENTHVWVSGQPLKYKNYVSGGLKDTGSEDCVEANLKSSNDVNTLTWNDVDCTWTYPYACEIWLPVNWTQKGFDISTKPGRALKFFKEATTWDDAKKKCGNLIRPGFLITVDDEDVNAWVMDKKVVTWIGLNDKDVEGTHVWDSNVPLDYTNYVEGNYDAGGEDCFVANWANSNGEHSLAWNDVPCGSSYAKAYACEIWL